MERILIDTSLLAIPNFAVDEITAIELFDRVANLGLAALEGDVITTYISCHAEDTLWGSNVGPDYEQISQFVELMNVGDIYSPQDLLKAYNTIFMQSGRAESANGFGVEDYSDFVIDIDMDALAPQEMVWHSKRCLLEGAWLRQSGRFWIVATPVANLGGGELVVSGTVTSVTGQAPGGEAPPIGVAASVRSLSRASDLVSHGDSLRIWNSAESAADLYFAIMLGALALSKGDPTLNPSSFSIGDEFLSSLNDHQCLDGKFASAAHALVVSIVAGTCNKRIGTMGKPQEVRDDGSRGMRVHLTKGKEGLRLLFWQGQSHIEFANVGVKHELLIEHGNPPGTSLGLEALQ